MKRLFLIRHAKSSWSDPSRVDFDRPLNKRGKRDAPFMGKRLAEYSIRPDLVVSSSAKRAQKTARLVCREIDYPKEAIVFTEKLYTSDLFQFTGIIRNTSETVASLALVGHNYVITECAEWLTGRAIVNIPTSGIVGIELDIKKWREVVEQSGTLLFFDYPKKHRDRGFAG